jgi:predicted RNA-binding protein YlxR (DUF448 family)
MPKEALIRFALSADGEVTPDVGRRLGGRGVWLTASRAVVEDAARRGVFPKGFKRSARPRPDLAEQTDRALAERAIAALAAANRAGLVAAAPEGDQAALRAGGAVAIVEAADSANAGGFAGNSCSNSWDLPVIRALTKAQLGLALGRPNVVHAALLAGPASTLFLTCCDGLVRYRTPEDEASPVGRKQLGRKQLVENQAAH